MAGKLEKFIDEAEVSLRPIEVNAYINTSTGKIEFKGESVDVIITESPVTLILCLRGGSVGLISTVICAFSAKFGKPYMIYMAQDLFGGSYIMAHFLTTDSIDLYKAKLIVLLAEFFNGAEKVRFIDFSEVEKEAERYLSQYFQP